MPGSLSRHSLAEQGLAGRVVPLPDSLDNTLLALATWSTDHQEHRLSLACLGPGIPGAAAPQLTSLASLALGDRGVAVLAARTAAGADGSLVLAVTRCGKVHALRLGVPSGWDGGLEGLTLRGDGVARGALLPSADLGCTHVTGAALLPGTPRAVAVGWDGAHVALDLGTAHATRLTSTAGMGATCVSAAGAAGAYIVGNWAGDAQVWDARAPAGGPTASATGVGPSLQGDGAPLQGVWVAEAEPHRVATGSAGGRLAVWDLRAAGAPVWAAALGGAGPPAGAAHVPGRSGDTLVYATLGGALGLADRAAGVAELYREPAAGFSALLSRGTDLLALTDQEGLVLLERGLEV